MDDKRKADAETPVVLDEDIKKILSTVKRVPNRSVNNSRNGRKQEKERRSKRNTVRLVILIALAVVLLVAGVILTVRGLRQSNPSIKGTWSYDDVTVYSFDGKGHGNLVLPLGSYEFSYVLDGDILKLDFADGSVEDRNYTCSITGDMMILTGEDGSSFQFAKKTEK